MNDSQDLERRLDLALEERVGCAQSPDLAERVLGASREARSSALDRVRVAESAGSRSPRSARWFVAAAIVLLGLGIVITVRATLDRTEEDSGVASPNASDADVQNPELVRPTTVAEFQALARDAVALSFRTVRAGGHDLRASDAEFRIDGAVPASRLLADLFARLGPTELAGWEPANRIRIDLPGGKYMQFAVDNGRRITVWGLGDFHIDPRVAEKLRGFLGAAEWDARRELGIVLDPIEIAMLHGEAFAADLETLKIAKLDDDNASMLQRFRSLRRLEIESSPGLGPAGMTQIAKLTTIESIHARWANFSDAAIAELAALPNLERLELERLGARRRGVPRPPFDGSGFAAFAEHTKLRHLDLSWAAGILDEGLQAIAAIPQLEHLELDGFGREIVTDAPLSRLAGAKNLRVLVLDRTALDVDGSCAVFWGLLRLEVLSVSQTNLADGGLRELFAMPRLRTLDVSHCKRLTSDGFVGVWNLPELRSLKANNCGNLRWAALVHLAGCRQLEELDVSNQRLGSDFNMPILPSLRRVNFSFTGVGDRIFGCLPLTELRELDLAGNDAITDEGLRELAKAAKLTRLSLNVCDGFTGDGVEIVKRALPDTDIVWPDRFR